MSFKAKAKEEWIQLARDVKETTHEWNTSTLPDGEYQVKVIASDKPDNTLETAMETARVSSNFTVDHTPPAIAELKASVDGNKASVSGEAADENSVVDLRYQIDSQGDWQPASPSDTLFDSPKETFTLVTRPLAAGAHRITVRATDNHGNSSYKAVTVTVK